jgi:CHAT domain-containing protein
MRSQAAASIRLFRAACIAAVALALPAGAAMAATTPQAVGKSAGKPNINLGADPTGRVCSGRRLYGDPLLRAGTRDYAYDVSCGRSGSIGRIYLLGSRPKDAALREWRDVIAPLCVAPRPQDWSPSGLQAELGLFCAGGSSVGSRPATVLLAASGSAGLAAGDGPVASAPVIEYALRILSGVAEEPARARQRGPRSSLLSNLESVVGGDLGGGGFTDFSSLRAAAFENNSMWTFGAAELQFADALRVHAGLWPEDYAGRGDLQSERALNLANQRRFAEAERVLADAEQNAAKSEDAFLRAKVAAYAAIAALNAGQYAQAGQRAVRARELLEAWRKSGQVEREQADQAAARLPAAKRAAILDSQMLRTLAIAASRDPAGGEWRDSLTKAADVASALDARSGGWLQSGLAQDRALLELREGRPQAAARILEEGLERYRRFALGTRVEANMLMDIGEALAAMGRKEDALARYAEAFEIYREQIENRGVAPIRGLRYLEALAENMPAVVKPAEAAPMFAAFETLASPAVAQTAAATAARLLAGRNGAVIRAWQDTDRALRRAQTKLSNLPTETSADVRRTAEEEVASWRRRSDELEQQVALLFPKFGVLTMEPVTISTLSESLGGGERLVRLALGTDRGIGMLVDRESVRVFRIKIGESRAAELVARIKTSVRNVEAEFDRAAAAELFEGVFGGIRDVLLVDTAPERLIVEASGALASLPFPVLITGERGADGEPWLTRRFSVVAVPSMRAFVSARAAGPSQGTIPFIGFGDFLPLADSASAAAIANAVVTARKLPAACGPRLTAALAKLPRLRGTAVELETVKAILGGSDDSIRLRERFTDRAVLRDERLEAAKVLMFSTHGVFASEFPEAEGCLPDAGLLSSAVSPNAGVVLDSAQVLDLKLDADIVVLSACDTGNPQPVAPGETGLPSGGDALSGLARSFFYAGARSVLVSHWPLPDEATVAVMRGLFERLKAGDGLPEALRAAQMAQIQSGADDPLAWAALAVVGAPQAR